MSIMNWLNKDAKRDNENVYNLHKDYAEGKLPRQEYINKLTQELLHTFLSENAISILKKNNIDVMAVNKESLPKCTTQEMVLLTEECRRAAICISRLFDIVKERALQKDNAADHFSKRYKDVEVITSKQWKEIYNNEPLKTYPISMHKMETLWDHFVMHTSTFKLLLPMIAFKYADMISAKASFDCEK